LSKHCDKCGARTGEDAGARVVNVAAEGSCNFCSRAQVGGGYPYRKVLQITSAGNGGIQVRICRVCWKRVKTIAGGVGFG